ncbi:MAG: helix-turn-helix domain-containing protein [Candidatus Omnitrophota bacterium]|jgi:excisionase family DNA binding protein
MEKLLTVPQVSELLGVSRSQVYKWVHYDFVPYLKIGSLVRFKETDLEKWLSHRRRNGRISYKIQVAS